MDMTVDGGTERSVVGKAGISISAISVYCSEDKLCPLHGIGIPMQSRCRQVAAQFIETRTLSETEL